MLTNTLLLVLGLILLMVGGNWFVDGAAGLARFLNVRPLIIGVVVIGFGTSAPEMLVSLFAIVAGNGGIAIGNVVGSNIANIALVMAVAAIIYPVVVHRSIFRKELPLMAILTLLFSLLVMVDGRLDILDGAILLVVFAATMAYLLGFVGKHEAGEDQTLDQEAAEMLAESPVLVIPGRPVVAAGQTLLGLTLILVGAQFTVQNAAAIARQFGVSDEVIGLTVVAVGTSLPELIAAMIAAWRRETDLIVGNVLGSNLYNLGFIGGLVALFSGTGLQIEDQIRFVSTLIMGALTLLLVPVLYNDSKMSRIEGGLLVIGYFVYTVLLF